MPKGSIMFRGILQDPQVSCRVLSLAVDSRGKELQAEDSKAKEVDTSEAKPETSTPDRPEAPKRLRIEGSKVLAPSRG